MTQVFFLIQKEFFFLNSLFGILIDDWNNRFFKDQNRLLNYKSKDKYRCSSQKHLLTSSNPTILWLHKILQQARIDVHAEIATKDAIS
jgi:hypothetical protein